MKKRSKIIINAIKILKYLIDNNAMVGKSIKVKDIYDSVNLPREEFDSADTYLLQQKYVEGTLGGMDGSRWLTGAGVEFEENISEEESVISKNAGNKTMPDEQKVFVAHGRDNRLRTDFFSFLRALDLQPIEWSEAIRLTEKTSPYIGEVLDSAFENAQAVIVLLSPDDEVRLSPELWEPDEEVAEKEYQCQARPNVLFEAGLAFGRKPDRTLLIEVGKVKGFSDVAGRHVIRLSNDLDKRTDVAERLRTAGCKISTEGEKWQQVGDFSVSRGKLTLVSKENSEEWSVKRVDLNYPRDSGLQAELESKGYKVRWCSDDKLARRLDINGWSLVTQSTQSGRKTVLKLKDGPYDQTLIMKKES
ncbi:MAG: hypothetical protein A2Z08_03515 [Deltaproteobacteria bacterium RBG_16_54_11]|nr:MAG: hypothetical protein A2Z08_03515 [Deltaproteobacteria bacterium RBG_16_54_11]